jgi:hypothetical protein
MREEISRKTIKWVELNESENTIHQLLGVHKLVLRGKLIELDVEIRDLFSKTGTIY